MSKFNAYWRKEFKRFFCKKTTVILILLLVLSMFGSQNYIYEYKKVLIKAKEFKKNETVMFQKIMNYGHYSDKGINVFFIPSASGIFFVNPAILSELVARINSIATLDIHNNCISGNLFKGNTFLNLKFSNIVFILGIIAVLYLGYTSIRDKEYLKFLSSHWRPWKIFLSVVFTRTVFFTLCFVVIAGLTLGLTALQGIELTQADSGGFCGFMLNAFFLLLFFFLTGTVIGSIQSPAKRFWALLIILSAFLILIPVIKSVIIANAAKKIPSSFELLNKKYKVVNEFEKRIAKEKGEFKENTIEAAREIVEEYWAKDSKEILALEEDLLKQVSRVVALNDDLSLLTPVTVYNSTCHSVSSRSYENFREFLKYLIQLRRGFLRFWIDRVYYNDPKKLVSFVKNDENLFQGKSRLPQNFLKSIPANLAWITLLLFVSFFLMKKWLYTPDNEKPLKENDREFKLKKDGINTLVSLKTVIRDQLYLYFSVQRGKSKFSDPHLRLTLEDQPVTANGRHNGFRYICGPASIPKDIKAKDFITYICDVNGLCSSEKAVIQGNLDHDIPLNKCFGELEDQQKADVLISVISHIKGTVFVVNDIGRDLPLPVMVKLKDQLDALVKKGALVIYLTKEQAYSVNRYDPARDVLNLPEWFDMIEAHRFLLKENKRPENHDHA